MFSCRTSIAYNWELYKVNDDCSEPNDLAAREPKKLRELQDLFWAEAAKYITIAPRVDFKERTLKAIRSDLPLFLIQAIANLFRQGVGGEGLLQERHFGAQDTVANHHIVRIAALEEYL